MEATGGENDDSNKKPSPPLTLKYVRRLDRTPEKDFHLRSKESKMRASMTRSLVEKVRKKITKLEDEVDERTKEVEEERKLRKQAEELLLYKDMYRNPEVNQELRDRLPRANKSDPFKREEVTETDNSSIEEDIVTDEESQSLQQPKMDPDSLKSLESQIVRDGDVRPKTAPVSRKSLKFSEEPKQNQDSSSSEPGLFERSSGFPRIGLTPPTHGFYGHAFGANPFMPYNGNFLSNGAYQSPLLHSTAAFQQSSLFRPMSTPTLNSATELNNVPLSQRLSQSFTAPTETSATNFDNNRNVNGAAKDISGSLGATDGHMPPERSGEQTMRSSSNLSGSRAFLPNHRSPLHTSVLPDPFIPNISPRLNGAGASNYGTEYSRHIMSLLNEIDSQRTEKKKMMEKLAEKERELETLKVTMKLDGVETQASGSDRERAAGLVQEVYTAQKKREEAVNGRLKQANDERDDVMERLRELERRLDAQSSHGYAGSEDGQLFDEEQFENEDISLLLSQMESDSPPDKESPTLLRKIEVMRQRQREVTNEEMQIVMDQRDVAMAKCRKLEAELLHYQKQLDADGGTDKNLQAKLATLQQERDLAVAKSKQLDQEIQTLRLYYSLHKSLSTENTLQQQANNTIHAYEEELGAVKQELQHVQKENHRLVSQLRATTIDKKQVQEALETMKQDKERLQRLATVLKRKLNAMNNEQQEEEES